MNGFLFTLLLSACADPVSPEQRIRAMLAAGEAAVESRSLSEAGEFISLTFRDEQGRGRRELMGILAGQFLHNRGIHLLVQVDSIDLEPDHRRAQAVLIVAMAGHNISSIGDLSSVRASLYRFDLLLQEEEGQWRVAGGRWRHATRDDFSG